MAEIIGLVSSIITFVDFGFKIVSGAKDVRDSVQGTMGEVCELDLIVTDVQHWNDLVKKQRTPGQKRSNDELHVLEMVDECEVLVGKLRSLISTLKVRVDARSKTLEGARVFTKSFLKQAEIKSLRSRLDDIAPRIENHVVNVMDQ